MNFLETVEGIIKEVRETYYPDITDDMLDEHGAVCYLNGQYGTRVDWDTNNHLPAFALVRKDEELCFIRLRAYKNGNVEVCCYGSGQMQPEEKLVYKIKKSLVKEGYDWGVKMDNEQIWNKPIYYYNQTLDYFGR